MMGSISRSVSTWPTAAVLHVVSRVRTLSGPEELREQIDKEDSQARHTDTDDTGIDFDDRPLRNIKIVPCRVGRIGELSKRLESQDADNCNTTCQSS